MFLVRQFARKAPATNIFFGNAVRNFGARSAMNVTPLAATSNLIHKRAPTELISGVRHGGAAAIAGGIAVAGVGGCMNGLGQLFAGLLVGMARNPSMGNDLFTRALIGIAMIELFTIVMVVFGVVLMYSE